MILDWIEGIREGVHSFLIGMRTTGRFFLENMRDEGGGSSVTREYPAEPREIVGERSRGHLFNDANRCIVCHACDLVCPVDCFVMDGERDENNKMRASRFDIDLSKCIYCGLCVRACPTDSLSMTAEFEIDPQHSDFGRFLFLRDGDQLDQRLESPDVDRLTRLANQPREGLDATDRDWLDQRIATGGRHLIGMYGLGYFTAEEKARVDAEREAKKKAKDAAKVKPEPKPPTDGKGAGA